MWLLHTVVAVETPKGSKTSASSGDDAGESVPASVLQSTRRWIESMSGQFLELTRRLKQATDAATREARKVAHLRVELEMVAQPVHSVSSTTLADTSMWRVDRSSNPSLTDDLLLPPSTSVATPVRSRGIGSIGGPSAHAHSGASPGRVGGTSAATSTAPPSIFDKSPRSKMAGSILGLLPRSTK